ncbi:hypothetical protein [Leucobacter sp. OH1287]|uniref:hypothetical protein n=1 Tax=Leucobacter sp. OH1287 TaxID=2491049 RepID=UPI000F5D783B|nr:hypothetical protein [Leucobacter sp. OH1287]RRD61634.1 hypothetical protein EII30_02060 [Leucobacter sp. OH1287]
MIAVSDLVGVPQPVALRVLAYADGIAPGILTVEDQGLRDRAVAVLSGIAAEVAKRGSSAVAAQSVGNASVRYESVSGFFTAEDRLALQRIVAVAGHSGLDGLPRGIFPPSDLTRRLGRS